MCEISQTLVLLILDVHTSSLRSESKVSCSRWHCTPNGMLCNVKSKIGKHQHENCKKALENFVSDLNQSVRRM